VIDARATAHYKRAMKAPDGEEMHAALQYHRKAIEEFPADDRYRLVVPYVELILEKVGPREAEKERPLLQHAEKLTKIERDRRPECPSTYYCLYRIYRLLGKDQLAIHYQDLHAQKKAEYVDKEHYDDRGRPRCR